MNTVVFLLFAVFVMFVASFVLRRDPNKWYGEMLCLKCGYQWNSRRSTPPARCAKCSAKEIQIVTEAMKQAKAAPSDQGINYEIVDARTDPLYEQAVQIVLTTGRPSISLLQRELQIEAVRAISFIQTMEKERLVSPANEIGLRTVLVASPEMVEK